MDIGEKLWDEYKKSKSKEIREKLILEYAPLVKIVAGKLAMYLGSHVEYEELTSYGIFGLIDAIDKFDVNKEVKFETYASLRIRGSILDQIRKMDWIPRSIRQKQKKIDSVILELEMLNGERPSNEAIAEKLEISIDEFELWQSQLKTTALVALDEFADQGIDLAVDKSVTPRFEQPGEEMEKEELKGIIKDSLEVLTDKEKKVVLLYYYEELTLKEISYVLEVTESRVSQLHTKALSKMKDKLRKYLECL